MAGRKRLDTKLSALKEAGSLNPRPGRVVDGLFFDSEFFDSRDLLQVKYEMLRRVQDEGASVTAVVATFGFSRPSFYEARAAFARAGLVGLLPRKRGPRGGHKLDADVIAFIVRARVDDPSLTARRLVPLVREHFDLQVHRRSIERALRRREKKRT